MKILSVEAELLNVEGRTVRYDNSNSHYPEFCECT